MKDAELVVALSALDSKSAAEREKAAVQLWKWVAWHAKRHPSVCGKRGIPDADEVANDVANKLLSKPETRARVIDVRHPSNYVRTIIDRTITDRHRRKTDRFHHNVKTLDKLQESRLEDADSAEVEEIVERLDTLRYLRSKMTVDEQNLVRLRFWDGLTFRQIAELLGLEYATVAQRLYRLLDKLRGILGDADAAD
jgi:RNA polymerase sigma-70 factor (ECF subfamily)